MPGNDQFPFNNISDIDLSEVFNSGEILEQEINECLDPLSVQDANYNNDLDVNQFYIRSRNIEFPKSEYAYLENFSSLCNNSNFNLFSLNIRSMSTNFQYFKDTVLCNNITFDVLGFTETRLDGDISTLYTLPAYEMFTKNRNRYGGGVAVYVSSKYTSCLVNEYSRMESFIESVGVEMKVNGKKFLSICIYRPPQGNINDFLNFLNGILNIIKNQNYNEIFIFGDLNLNLLNNDDDNIQELSNTMYSYSLFPLTTLPTRVTATSATLIDHIWSTYIENNVGNYVIKADITDHFPSVSLFKCSSTAPPPTFIRKRSFTQDALEKFSTELSNINWSHVFNCDCPNKSYDLFFDKLKIVFDSCFPGKVFRIHNKNNRSPHITPALKKSIREKHRLEKLAYKWPLTYREHYKAYRNRLTSILKEAKKKYHHDQLVASQGNPKSHWKSINNILGKSRNSHTREIELKPICSDIPDKFNEHFLSAGEQDIDIVDNAFLNYLHNPPNYSMYLSPATISEVENCIKAFKTSSSGYDDISPVVLKHAASYIAIPLTHIVNLTLKTGIFPDALKKAKIVPLLKSGNRSDIKNYRPISILPACSKVFEKIITSRLVTFFENNSLLIDSQHGFRAGRSTETAILQFINNVYQCLEKKHHVVGVFLDLSKAFDTLNHEILLRKLNHYGVRGTPLKLFESYLANRSQAVYCNSVHSTFRAINKGVPQGSVLGPILFLIYINDIVNVTSKFKYTIYADDTNLLMNNININNLHTDLIAELRNINHWTKINKLSLNTTKTNYILFQNRSIQHNISPVTIEGVMIDRVQNIKFLGVIIDENVNWNQHISFVTNKLVRMCGILFRVRNNLTPESLTSIYYTLCYPHLTYCVSVWACTWQSFLRKVSIAQNKIFRCIFFMNRFESTRNLLNTQNFLSFTNIHKYFLLLSIYKYLTQYCGTQPFRVIHTPYDIRGNYVNLICPQFRTSLFKNSVLCSGPHEWNSLPLEIKTLLRSGNLSSFKKHVKTYLYNSQNT